MEYGKYFSSLPGGVCVSCDSVIVDFKLDKNKGQALLDFIQSRVLWQYDYFERFGGIGRFKHSFTFDFGQKSTVTLLIGLYGASGTLEADKVRLDFNPNKVDCQELEDIIFHCRLWAKRSVLVRWDLAIDFPAPRRDFILVRTDRRKRGLEEVSDDNFTEYLGRRNSPGRYKLYNKSVESGLDYPLTRSELTCSGSWTASECLDHLPYVFRYEPFADDGVKQFPKSALSAYAAMLIRHPEEAFLIDFFNWKQKKCLISILQQCSSDTSSVHAVVGVGVVDSIISAIRKNILA